MILNIKIITIEITTTIIILIMWDKITRNRNSLSSNITIKLIEIIAITAAIIKMIIIIRLSTLKKVNKMLINLPHKFIQKLMKVQTICFFYLKK